jgi:hypothetical protein
MERTISPKVQATTITEVAPNPENILRTGLAFWASKVLLTATQLELFTHLAGRGSLTAADVRAIYDLKCSDRHLFDFLDTLTSLGFLQRKGLLESAVYSNTTETEIFLDKNKPGYIGGMLQMANNRLYSFWHHLEEGLRTGQQQNEAKYGEDLFATIYNEPARLKEFIQAMAGVQMGAFMALAANFDFSSYKTLTDVGGAGAHLSLCVARSQPHMRCTNFDLPAVQPIAHENIHVQGLNERITAVSGDFFNDPLPGADVITMGNILHDWNEEKKVTLMRKAYEALPQGGAFIAIENVIDDERRANSFGLMMSLNMLIETTEGFDYTYADFQRWAKEAGFSRTAIIPLAGPTSAAIAYK